MMNGAMSDVHLVLGSSMRVSPANMMVMTSAMLGGKVVIVNLQKTPFDGLAEFVIHGMIDDVMERLMKKLDMDIPEFKLERWAKVTLQDKNSVKIAGIDSLGDPYTLFPKVFVNGKESNQNNITSTSEPVKMEFSFQGHYNEPNLEFNIPYELLE